MVRHFGQQIADMMENVDERPRGVCQKPASGRPIQTLPLSSMSLGPTGTKPALVASPKVSAVLCGSHHARIDYS